MVVILVFVGSSVLSLESGGSLASTSHEREWIGAVDGMREKMPARGEILRIFME